MSYTLDTQYLINNIQSILDKVHTHPQKRKIKLKHDRISFACPICGDSHNDPSQKRGHLFFNNLYYKCYNEDCRSTFTKLCKIYDIQLDPNKKLELINYIDLNFQAYKQNDDDFIIDNLDKLIPFDDLQKWFDSGVGPLRGFKPVTFGSKVYYYLIARGFPDNIIKDNFYEGIKYNNKYSEPYVVFINKLKDKVIGIQERNLQSGFNRKFKIWTFKELYDKIYNDELDIIESISYNKLSYLFNIFNVNYDSVITIFEGYLDSLFFPNAVGAVGADTDFSFLTKNEINIRFFFDNDNKGKRKAQYWLKQGYNVFLWEKLINDLGKTETDIHKFKKWFNTNITDLNKLMQLYPIHWKKLEKYFSNNIFDLLYINYDKSIKKYIKETNIHNINWDKHKKI